MLPQHCLMAMPGGQLPRVPGGQHPQVLGSLLPQVPSPSVQHPQVLGGQHISQWTSGGSNLQSSGGDDLDLAGGGDMQGQVHPHLPMAALAGGDSDFVSGMAYTSSDNRYTTLEHTSNDNSFVNGNGYFSNMMMDDTNQNDIYNSNNTYVDQQSQAMQVVPAPTSTRPNHKRQKNFSDHEDEILVSAWLNISLDPIVGKDKKGSRYWDRISEYFHTHKTCQSKRTINSLSHRWDTIQRCVNKFCRLQRRVLCTSLKTSMTNHFISCIAGIS